LSLRLPDGFLNWLELSPRVSSVLDTPLTDSLAIATRLRCAEDTFTSFEPLVRSVPYPCVSLG
jgi:hypothetical protein